jgi:hypothetical protein
MAQVNSNKEQLSIVKASLAEHKKKLDEVISKQK